MKPEKIDTKEPAWSQIKGIVRDALSKEFNYAAIRPKDATRFFANQAKTFETALKSVDLIMKDADDEILELVPETVEAGRGP